MPELVVKFQIGASEFSTFAGIYYIGYIIVHIPVGLLLSRWGARIILPLCISLTFLGLTPLIYSSSWSYIILGRLITGIGSSAAIVGALQIFRVTSPRYFSQILGGMVCAGLVIAVYVSKPLAELLSSMGVGKTINIFVLAGVALAIITFYILPKEELPPSKTNLVVDIKKVMANYKLILLSICAGLMVGPMEGFVDGWGTAFLHATKHISRETAANIVSYILTGMCIGCIILPYLSDKTNKPLQVTLIASLIMASCFFFLMFSHVATDILKIICLVIGIVCAYQVVIIPKITTFVTENLSGLAGAVANMIIMGFGYIFHKAIGLTMDRLWDGTLHDGVKVYSEDIYMQSIALIPWAIIIASIGLIFFLIREVTGKNTNSCTM